MGFLLKKAISWALMPVSLILILLVAGIWFHWRGRRRRLALSLEIASAVILLLCANVTFSNALIRPLETAYPPVPELWPAASTPVELLKVRYVVVLGGGNTDAPEIPATHRLSSSALGRVAEAVRLLRVLPEARLIVSGPGDKGRPTHASVLEDAAVSLGIDRSKIIRIETALDTEDEATAVHNLVGNSPVALVTSAWHMPRAAALVRAAGVSALPAPADFVSSPWERWSASDLLWNIESLDRSTRAIHERLGQLWNKIRGIY